VKTYGTERGVYFSTNSGDSWSLFCEGLPNAPTMQVFVESNYLYAVTFGRGLWRTYLLKKRQLFVKGS
jgi:hypothetical protein